MLNTNSPPFQELVRRQSRVRWVKCFMTRGCWLLRKLLNAQRQTSLVGQTGPKTKKLFEKALGKVLFIDEAYRLSRGHFAQEATDELVGLLTHSNFKSKLIVILAG